MDLPELRRRLESAFGLLLSSISDEQLGRAVQQAGPGASLERLADHLPISESSLLRDPEVWTWLSHELAPRLSAAAARGAPLKLLSLGCSDGQEVFSLAITALEAARAQGLDPEATARDLVWAEGMDLSEGRVERARRGELADWSVRTRLTPGLARHLTRIDGGWRVSSTLQAVCRFEVGNLVALPPQRVAPFDVVLCRHVLIYFAPQRAREVVSTIASQLAPGALLVLAPVEAHLLDGVPGLESAGPVGAARRSEPKRAPPPEANSVRARAPAAAPVSGTAEEHRGRAVRAADAGQLHQALALARAAAFLEPHHVGGRFLLARLQLQLEPALGRRMLHSLLADVRQGAAQTDPDLSLQQLTLAATALLGSQR